MHNDDKSFLRRVLHGVGGQSYLRVIQVLYTIGLVPTLIGAWGVDGYGTWLVLTALAVYMSMSSSGLSSASAAEMMQAVGADDYARAGLAFRQSVNLLSILMTAIILPLLLLAFVLPLVRLLNLVGISDVQAFLVLLFMAIEVVTSTIRLLAGSAIAASGRYGLSESISATTKLAELCIIVFIVTQMQAGVVPAAMVVAGASCADLLLNLLVSRGRVPWARFDFCHLDIAWARNFLRPTMGNFILSAAVSAVTVQAPRLVLSALLGPAAVGMFGVYANAMRVMEQFTGLISSTLIFEIARELGRERLERVQSLILTATQFVLACSLVLSAAGLLTGPWVFAVWTQGKIAFGYALMAVFLLAGTVSQIGKVAQFYLVGSNRILGPSILMLLGACLGVAIGGALAGPLGVMGMAIGTLTAEAAIMAAGMSATAGAVGMSRVQLAVRSLRLDMGLMLVWRQLRCQLTG